MIEESDRLALHLRRLRLRHFEILLAVARQGSLTAAAQALDCGQPAVSQWLAEIEAAVGVRLFERGRQLKPTPHLAPVLRHARRVVADGQRLQRELDAVSAGAQGVVRIGTMVVASAGLLPRALLALRASGSPMRLEVVEDIAQGLWERFERRELDLIVGRLDERAFAPHIEAQALYQDPHCVVAGRKHPLLRGTPTWARAARHPWILPPRQTELRRAIDATFLQEGLPPATPWLESAVPTVIQRLMQATDCLAVVSGTAGRYYEELGALRVVRLALKYDVGPIGMAWARGDDSPALAQVLDALRGASPPPSPAEGRSGQGPAAPTSKPRPTIQRKR